MQGTVFDIQNYALYDGPGIRTCVFFKGCPLDCEWCHNPESKKPLPEMAFLQELCVGCGECAKACPESAIKIRGGRPKRDEAACAVCGECAAACPTGAMQIIGKKMSAGEIADRVSQDAPFYNNSGGGVTISGGEATLQKSFLLETLDAVKSRNIHIA
ncbi:MAG TPA: glycyl-radical enzyme activating protein, partial [bacterium]|nr:glycyl-radical enzyme activating protein [bacterium]